MAGEWDIVAAAKDFSEAGERNTEEAKKAKASSVGTIGAVDDDPDIEIDDDDGQQQAV